MLARKVTTLERSLKLPTENFKPNLDLALCATGTDGWIALFLAVGGRTLTSLAGGNFKRTEVYPAT